jgi:hypothetical protein
MVGDKILFNDCRMPLQGQDREDGKDGQGRSKCARDQRSEPNLKVWIQKEEFLPK